MLFSLLTRRRNDRISVRLSLSYNMSVLYNILTNTVAYIVDYNWIVHNMTLSYLILTTPRGKSCFNICFIKEKRILSKPHESWLIHSSVSDVSSQSLCLDEFLWQLTVRSLAAWEEWLAEDNDRFLHPLSKQAMAPVCPAPHLWDPPVHQPGFMRHDQNRGQRRRRNIRMYKVSQALLLHAECKKV